MYISRREKQINPTTFCALPKKYEIVDDYLIRGPHPCFCDVFTLKKEGVNQIYDFRHKSIKGFKWVERLACKLANVEYKRKPYSFLLDRFPSQKDYEAIAQEVVENGKNGGKSLFHCNSGTHRTALMTTFYDITKGQSLEKCKKENPSFHETVNKAIHKHITSKAYFSRNRVIANSLNPITQAKNVFNNKVVVATKRAYELFLEMMKK